MECSNCRNWWCWVTNLSLSRFAIEKLFIYLFNNSSRSSMKNKTSWFSSLPPSCWNLLEITQHTYHVWTGSSALEDVWKTLNPDRCQLAGILDFCLTNAFLPMQHYQNPKLEHYKFKICASHSLTAFKSNSLCQTRKLEVSTEMPLHPLEKLEYSYTCFHCQHGFDKSSTSNNSTTFRCGECKLPLCRPSKGNFWHLHILNGIPKKMCLSKIKNQWEKMGQCLMSL